MLVPFKTLSDLRQLSNAKSLHYLIQLAKSLKPKYGPTLFRQFQQITFMKSSVDNLAESLLPSHYRQENAKRIKTKADGNCLFNAASMAICVSDKFSSDLRIMTTIELVTNSTKKWWFDKTKYRTTGCWGYLLCINFLQFICWNVFRLGIWSCFQTRNYGHSLIWHLLRAASNNGISLS